MKDKTFDVFGFMFALAILLSMLLVFIVKLWIMVVASVCGYVLFLIAFSRKHETKQYLVLLYWSLALVSIGIMVLLMFFPEKIVGGRMSNISDANFVEKVFGNKYLNKVGGSWWNVTYAVDTAKLIKAYHTHMGIFIVFLIVIIIVCGIILSFNIGRYDERRYGWTLCIPLISVIALLTVNLPLSISWTPFFIVCVMIEVCSSLNAFFFGIDDGEDRGRSSGSSGGDTYHVLIWKD